MPSDGSRLKALAAATILLVSVGAGVTAFTQDAPTDDRTPETTASSDDEAEAQSPDDPAPSTSLETEASSDLAPSDFDGLVHERFTGSFDEAPATGSLDLRIDDGPVRVVGWEKPSYEVLVLQENASDGPAAHDYETTVDFQDDSSGDSLDLSLVVDRDGTYGAGVQSNVASTDDPHKDRGIVAFVPAATAYDDVTACSGQDHAFEQAWEDSWESVPWPWADDHRNVEVDGCIEAEDSPGLHVSPDANVERNDTSFTYGDGPIDVLTGVEDLQGSSLRVADDHGDVILTEADFGQVEALTGHGEVGAATLASDNATLLSGHGEIVVDGASGSDLTVFSEHGDVEADFKPTRNGDVSAISDHGEVQVTLAPAADGIGYDAVLGTDHGELTVALSDATVEYQDDEDNRSWQDPGYWTGILEEDEGYDDTATAVTGNHGTAPVQTSVEAFSDHGDVFVSDGVGEVVHVNEDDEDDER